MTSERRDAPAAATVHPCPAGDGCALNGGAVHCFHCRRNWPRDETWDVPFDERPVRESNAANIRDALRRSKDAGTRLKRAVLFLRHEAQQGSLSRERRWLIGYHAGLLLGQVMDDAESLVALVNEEQVEDCERYARTVYEELRARRLATKLEQVEGRTPEEAEAFQEKARRLRSV